jgi:hypothetical protein
MIVAFGIWMGGELVEAITLNAIPATEDMENGIMAIDSITSTVMAGFGIFLIARFLWLKSSMPIEPKYLRS